MKGTLCLMIAFVLLRKERKGLVDGTELQILGLNFTNHSMNASVETTPATTTTTEPQKIGENTFRSEVYKLHANSLILLHAQRTRSGVGAKKSQLNVKSSNTGINYHTRKKTNDSVNVVDIEKQLEAKLGDLPQIRQKRSNNEQNEFTGNIPGNMQGNKSLETPCAQPMYNLTDSTDCQHAGTGQHQHHHHRHSHRHSRKRQWRSIIQGEDIYGEDVKKTKVYPEKFPDRRKDKSKETKRNVLVEKDILQNSLLLTTDENSKRRRLRRALSMMGTDLDDNPLYDSQNGGVAPHRLTHISQDNSVNKDGVEGDPLSMAPPVIIPLRNSKGKTKPNLQLKYQGRSFDFNGPNNMYPNSDMYEEEPNIPRIPKIDEDFKIPPISNIQPIEKDDELDEDIADKRNLVSLDQFVHDELEDSVEQIGPVKRMTEPTPIPDLSTISSIPDITNIPDITDIKSIPAPAKDKSNSRSNSYGNSNL